MDPDLAQRAASLLEDPELSGKLERLARLLNEASRTLNLTAVRGVEAVRVRHVLDSLVAAPLLRAAAGELSRSRRPRLADVGSGAGFPGLALAAALPEWDVLSIESTTKKARFQEDAAREMGLANFQVLAERAETAGRDPSLRESFDAASARAVGALNVLVELTFPLLRVGGRLIAWKGPKAQAELTEAREALRVLHGRAVDSAVYALPAADGGSEAPTFELTVIEKTAPTPERYPRRPGTAARKPIR